MACEFRGYRPGDFTAMFALDEVCFAPQFRFTRRAMRGFAEAVRALVVIADDAETLMGFCIVHVEGKATERVGYVVTLDVAPEFRRMGLAAELMQRVEAQALERGCCAMVLHVFVGNAEAIRFYQRLGYEPVRPERGFYGVDSDGSPVDAWLYRKVLFH